MQSEKSDRQHAALWLIGQDMPGLLNLGATFVAEHGGNIDKDIADKFGEKAVVFMSITAHPREIERMDKAKARFKESSGCGVVFKPMKEPTVPDGFQEDLYGFDIITDDAIGVVAAVTRLVETYGLLIVGHTGERRVVPGPKPLVQGGQKFVVLLPNEFDATGFRGKLSELVERYNGTIVSSLRPVPGLLWWW